MSSMGLPGGLSASRVHEQQLVEA